jgi:hypothetical protein
VLPSGFYAASQILPLGTFLVSSNSTCVRGGLGWIGGPPRRGVGGVESEGVGGNDIVIVLFLKRQAQEFQHST